VLEARKPLPSRNCSARRPLPKMRHFSASYLIFSSFVISVRRQMQVRRRSGDKHRILASVASRSAASPPSSSALRSTMIKPLGHHKKINVGVFSLSGSFLYLRSSIYLIALDVSWFLPKSKVLSNLFPASSSQLHTSNLQNDTMEFFKHWC
jgi:hypothetical protein